MPKGVRVKADSPLLGGSPSLAFEISHLEPHQVQEALPMDGSAQVEGQSLTLMTQFAAEMQAAISEPTFQFTRMVDRFNEIGNQFDRLVEQWTKVGSQINALLEPRGMGDVDAGSATGNLATVLARADRRLAELEATISQFNDWIADPALRDDVRATATNAKVATEKITDSLERADDLLANAKDDLSRLTLRYIAVADDMSGLIQTLQQAAASANTSDGTLGRLLNDAALYNNLNDSAQRLVQALDEFRLLIRKWQEEGLPIQF